MTKKDGDKLREMKSELMRMAEVYRPVGAAKDSDRSESRQMEHLAIGIDFLLQGKYAYLVLADERR